MEQILNDTVFALDIGTRTVIGAVCKKEGNRLKVIAQSMLEHDSRSMMDGQVHDIEKVSEVVIKVKKELESKTGFVLKEVAIAAAGRTLKTKSVHIEQDLGDETDINSVIINSLELSGVNEAARLIKGENRRMEDNFYCVGYSVVSYYLDGYPITSLLSHRGRYIGAQVLATFLPQSVVNSLYRVLENSGLTPISLTLEPIAALEAAVPENIRLLNIALVDIGAGTSDIAITRKGSITAYGMVSVAGDEVTEALAEEYILDFNTAEMIKRNALKKKKITFKDITGMKTSVESKQVLDCLAAASKRLAWEISEVLKSLNGDAPKALFCVGGGSQTPGLMDALADELNMDRQRVAVKNRNSIPNLEVCDELAEGPEGVTVIGIAIVAFKKVGHDFVNVYVNGKECRLFNSGNMNVCDVLGLIGYNPSALIGKSGKAVRFKLNGVEKKVAGHPPTPPEIYINKSQANLESNVAAGDFIDIVDAVDGQDAKPKIMDFIKGYQAISCSINGNCVVIEPKVIKNGAPAGYNDAISDGDEIDILLDNTVTAQAKILGISTDGKYITINGSIASDSSVINDGDEIAISDAVKHKDGEEKNQQTDDSITVLVNGKNVVLKGRDHIFIDVLDKAELDLSNIKGIIKLSVNGKDAEYSQPIHDGDVVEVRDGSVI